MAKFFETLDKRWAAGARVCIGLDPDLEKIPACAHGNFGYFLKEIILATHPMALAYKPNIAFFSGKQAKIRRAWLKDAIRLIRQVAPDVPVILDSKRGDIGNTNVGYVAEAFESFKVDAVTVHNYLGMEAMKPFLDQKDKGIIVLCRTSNPGAGEFQDLLVMPPIESAARWNIRYQSMRFYEYVAYRVSREWNYNGNCALVVGATAPEQLKEVRDIVGDDMPILIPGYGKQGGDLKASVENGVNSRKSGIIINESSRVIFASNGLDFAEAARTRVIDTTRKMNTILFPPGSFVDITV